MGRADKPRSLIFVIGMYMFVGLMTGIAVLSTRLDVFTYTILVHSMTFFVVGMAVTSESGDILFNTNESDVLVHRPIHPRTLLLAKSINLIILTLGSRRRAEPLSNLLRAGQRAARESGSRSCICFRWSCFVCSARRRSSVLTVW